MKKYGTMERGVVSDGTKQRKLVATGLLACTPTFILLYIFGMAGYNRFVIGGRACPMLPVDMIKARLSAIHTSIFPNPEKVCRG